MSETSTQLIASMRRIMEREITEANRLRAENKRLQAAARETERLRGENSALRRCLRGVAYSTRLRVESARHDLWRADALLRSAENVSVNTDTLPKMERAVVEAAAKAMGVAS